MVEYQRNERTNDAGRQGYKGVHAPFLRLNSVCVKVVLTGVRTHLVSSARLPHSGQRVLRVPAAVTVQSSSGEHVRLPEMANYDIRPSWDTLGPIWHKNAIRYATDEELIKWSSDPECNQRALCAEALPKRNADRAPRIAALNANPFDARTEVSADARYVVKHLWIYLRGVAVCAQHSLPDSQLNTQVMFEMELMTKKLLEGQELENRARQLGVDIRGDLITQSASGRMQRAADYEIQRRVIEAERARRDSWLWVLAMLSACASVLSALAAWFAVVRR